MAPVFRASGGGELMGDGRGAEMGEIDCEC